jgi:glycosyltransferase involved in cell wall biosynthesis
MENPGFEHWVRKTRQRPVYMIHDLIPITHPEYCRDGEDLRHGRRLDVVLRTAVAVIANSEDTKNALTRYAQLKQLPVPPVVVAPLASALTLTSAAASVAMMNEPYFVFLGTIESRKNHLLLLNVWRELALKLGPDTPKLIIIGQRGWECEQVADMLDRCPALHQHIKEIPDCTDADLAAWLRHARALVFPSFVEGYGMPLVEALSLGTPVIASGLPVFRESAGDVPEWLNPIDGMGWMQAIIDYSASNHPRRQAQLDRMRHWMKPRWDQHFEIVNEVLERLA